MPKPFSTKKHPLRLLACAAPAFLVFLSCAHYRNYIDPSSPVYAASAPPTSDPEPALRVVTFNIKNAHDIDGAIALLREHPRLHNADVLFLQEMDAPGTRRIAAALEYSYVYVPATHHIGAKRDRGNAILSRWPIRDTAKIILPHLATFGRTQRTATAGTVDIGEVPVRLYSVHVAVPVSLGSRARRDQLRAILDDAAQGPRRVIVAGDLNSHGLGRFFANTGFAWPSRDIGASTSHFALDHIFVRGFGLVAAESIGVVRENRGVSDHRPVWAVLTPDTLAPLPVGGYRFARADDSMPIRNFAWIDSALARGARPHREGIAALRGRGFRTIVNLTEDSRERRRTEESGMLCVELPMTADLWSRRPSEAQVRRFFEIVLDPQNRPAFVHGAYGEDRTGMMAALYRIEAQGWSAAAAIEEMRLLGCHGWCHDLIQYVRNYVPRGYAAPAAGTEPKRAPARGDEGR